MPPNTWIFVIDDSADDLELTRLALREAGCRCRIELATDGERALERLKKEADPPRLILLDLRMPRTDGFDVLRRVRGDPKLRECPVVIFTSSSLDRDRELAASLRASLYLEKPLDYEGSVRAAERVLELIGER